MLETTFNKVIGRKAWNFIKETPAPASSWKAFKNTFFYKVLPVAASGKGSEGATLVKIF